MSVKGTGPFLVTLQCCRSPNCVKLAASSGCRPDAGITTKWLANDLHIDHAAAREVLDEAFRGENEADDVGLHRDRGWRRRTVGSYPFARCVLPPATSKRCASTTSQQSLEFEMKELFGSNSPLPNLRHRIISSFGLRQGPRAPAELFTLKASAGIRTPVLSYGRVQVKPFVHVGTYTLIRLTLLGDTALPTGRRRRCSGCEMVMSRCLSTSPASWRGSSLHKSFAAPPITGSLHLQAALDRQYILRGERQRLPWTGCDWLK